MTIPQPKPVTIVIDPCDDYPLSLSEIRYTFETLLTISGFPWRFIRADLHSSCDIYFGHRCAQAKQAILKIEMNTVKKLTKPIAVRKETFRSNESILLLFFNDDDKTLPHVVEDGNKIVVLNNDILFSSFFLLSGWEESFIRRNRKGEHKIQDSFLYQNGLLHTPIINQYALLFRNLFSATHSFLPLWPQAKKYAVALSHDVDYPELIPHIEIFNM